MSKIKPTKTTTVIEYLEEITATDAKSDGKIDMDVARATHEALMRSYRRLERIYQHGDNSLLFFVEKLQTIPENKPLRINRRRFR